MNCRLAEWCGGYAQRRRAVLSLCIVTACAPVGARIAAESKPASLVIVQNDGVQDLSIYLEPNGVRTRKLGVARSSRTDTLLVGDQELTGRVSLVIVAVDPTSGAVRQSNAATAQSGAQYRLHIGPGGGQPFLSVRLPRL